MRNIHVKSTFPEALLTLWPGAYFPIALGPFLIAPVPFGDGIFGVQMLTLVMTWYGPYRRWKLWPVTIAICVILAMTFAKAHRQYEQIDAAQSSL